MPPIGIGEGLAILGPCVVAAVGVMKYKKNGDVSTAFCDERSGNIEKGIAEIKETNKLNFGEMKEIRDRLPRARVGK